ncbi:MAG: hypothetical protein C0169_01800 [Thermodesulfobacterium geofontis]|uniref:Penicillin-binding protein dimerisation domain-containing protein n=1 Tax=Thermodesulfobacterium geofontis TaxID=1295609 RepID=A0A2N7QG02_9BACT|nr:MAG: hypothetical protein C0169_01800 [Thermodesulfobacterium geofontis]
MKKKQKLLLLLSASLFLIILIINFSAERVTGKVPEYRVKRGYIFDRNFNPIAVSLENYKAYYLLKDNALFDSSDISFLKKYLGSTINLSKKGIILLSEDLSLEEVEKLKKEKNVIIEKTFKRKVLQPYLKFLVGETFNGYGVSGLEKIFDEHLRIGNPLVLSIDLNLEKKIYNIIYESNLPGFGIAVFDLETGELLGYLESENLRLFDNYYPLNLFGIHPSELKDFNWVLGENLMLKEMDTIKINLWHLAKWYMEKACNQSVIPTILPQKTKICEPNLEIFEKREYIYDLGKIFITVAFKNNKLILSSFAFNPQEKDLLSKNKKIINYIISML